MSLENNNNVKVMLWNTAGLYSMNIL